MSLSLAEQLAPLAIKPLPSPNAWRAVMEPKELAKYDRGDYDAINYETGAKDLRKAPRSARISRDNRLVPFLENDSDEVGENLPPVYPSPEEELRAGRYARGLEEIKANPRPCTNCGMDFGDGEDRVATLEFFGETTGHSYCRRCWEAFGIPRDQDPYFASLSKLDQQVWQLIKQSLTERDIAEKLTVGVRKVTQQMVSEIKLRIVRQTNERRKFNAAKRREMKYGQWVQ